MFDGTKQISDGTRFTGWGGPAYGAISPVHPPASTRASGSSFRGPRLDGFGMVWGGGSGGCVVFDGSLTRDTYQE